MIREVNSGLIQIPYFSTLKTKDDKTNQLIPYSVLREEALRDLRSCYEVTETLLRTKIISFIGTNILSSNLASKISQDEYSSIMENVRLLDDMLASLINRWNGPAFPRIFNIFLERGNLMEVLKMDGRNEREEAIKGAFYNIQGLDARLRDNGVYSPEIK